MDKKLIELSERVRAIEEKVFGKEVKQNPQETTKTDLTIDLDKLMQKHSKSFKGGIIFSGVAIPSKNPNRMVRWSGSGGFDSEIEVEKFLDNASANNISKFCSNFSSPEKMEIIKSLIKNGPMTQKEILESTGVSQGQFYHHVKELISNNIVEKHKKDHYDLSSMGHVISMSFMGIINSFLR